MQEELLDAGYYIKSNVLNTSNYSDVPQNRERIYIVCFKDKNLADKFKFPSKVNKLKSIKEMLETSVGEEYYYTVYLPLYSDRGGNKHVPEKSGLNQWNASGRKRHHDEVYIPIPRKVHEVAPEFFPSRDESFSLHLPDGRVLCAKVCQDGDKALMSDPNKSLGEWLLRDVFNLQPSELLTYEKLEEIGIDSVQINRFEDNTYEINFKELGSYEGFIN